MVGGGSREHVAGEIGAANGDTGELRDDELIGIRGCVGEMAPNMIINRHDEGPGGVEDGMEDME